MNQPSPFRGAPHPRWLGALAAASIVVIAVIAYGRSLDAPFLFDDAPAIERNQSIRKLWPIAEVLAPPQTAAGATGRPIVNLSLALNYAAGGLEPRGYHGFNLCAHALAGLVLFGLVRRTVERVVPHGPSDIAGVKPRTGPGRAEETTRCTFFAWAVAMLWVAHPLLTESVVCVIQRNEVLVGLFYLLTLYAFARAMDSAVAGRWLAVAVAACWLGMATKEVMVTAPLMVLLYDRTFVAGTFGEAWHRRWKFYLALASSWLLLAWLVAQHQQRAGTVGLGLGVSAWSYLLTQCRALVIYLKLSVWPHPLVLDYGVEVATRVGEIWMQGIAVAALLTGTAWALWRRPRAGFVGAWFFIVLAPSSSFVPLTTQPIAEHRMYLPLVAVVVAIMCTLARVAGRGLVGIGAMIAIALTAVTIRRTMDYRDGATIWADTIAKQPGNARAYASLGNVLAREQRWTEARGQYEKAIELRPDYADAQSDFGSVLLSLGDPGEAVRHFQQALKLKPADDDIRYNLGVALAAAGHTTEAAEIFRGVVGRNPKYAKAWNNLGDLCLRSGRAEEAAAAFARALEGDPTSAPAQHNLGLALMRLGRPAEAIAHYQAAMNGLKGSAAAHHNFAVALAAAGREKEAMAEDETALKLQPDFTAAAELLARLRAGRK